MSNIDPKAALQGTKGDSDEEKPFMMGLRRKKPLAEETLSYGRHWESWIRNCRL